MRRLTPFRVRAALIVFAVALPASLALEQTGSGNKPKPPRSSQAWTLDEALAHLGVAPHDSYVQYVAMQLARRENCAEQVSDDLARLAFGGGERRIVREARQNPDRAAVDLFDLFSGALAVQESLQLDVMRDNASADKAKKDAKTVAVASLAGPKVKSHPWKKMLAGRKPAVSPLACLVPEDFYVIEFRSIHHLFQTADLSDLWAREQFGQVSRDAGSRAAGLRLRQQLLLGTNGPAQALDDALIKEVVVAGSDLLLSEGSDVTLLFRAGKAETLKQLMDGAVADAARVRSDAKRSEGEYLGVKYTCLTTPQRDIHVYSAYPEPDLHVRSNSEVGFKRVLEAVKGKTPAGKAVRRLGESDEYAYIRTLMPRGAREEDGFIYLSDAFIRKLVGPSFKLAARRRTRCYNHLRMIGHAAAMYRTERGVAARSLDELAKADCCPGAFNQGALVCADGGTYRLSADGKHGTCSRHGSPDQLVPCCETAPTSVSPKEAELYNSFVKDYSRYWRTFFDPIAVRIHIAPERYRLETIVLPLIDNSIYTALAGTLKGKPEPLDALPVPRRNILSAAFRLDREGLLNVHEKDLKEMQKTLVEAAVKQRVPRKAAEAVDLLELLRHGLGNQIGLHVYDAATAFDFDLSRFFPLVLGDFGGQNWGDKGAISLEVLPIGYLAASLHSPVYLSLSVRDEKVVDRFIERLDQVMVRLAQYSEPLGGGLRIEGDFYRSRIGPGTMIRSFAFRFGPLTLRIHWGRIGKGLYIASKPYILEDLAKATAEAAKEKKVRNDPDATAHAMFRLRPRNWDRILPADRLNWAENSRQACLRNLGPIASASRAILARPGNAAANADKVDPEELAQRALRFANQLSAVQRFCPEGGRYSLSGDGKTCSCSIHGSLLAPEQGLAPKGDQAAAYPAATASLTFLEDGLHAVLVLDRK